MDVAEVLLPWLLAGVRLSNALVAWLMTYAIHSTLLIAGVWLFLATPAGRRLPAPGASWLWRFALVGGIASASIQSLRTPDPMAGTVRVGSARRAHTVVRVAVDRTPHVTPAVGRSGPGAAVVPPATGPANILEWRSAPTRLGVALDVQPVWIPVVVAGWLIGAMLLAGWYARARRRFFRILGERRNAAYTIAGGALRAVLDRSRVRRPIVLTISERLTSPVAIGTREICIPRRAPAELDPIRMESILAHELAHLERRDPGWLTAARLIEALLFVQPLNRLARRRMQEAAEFASDAWATRVVARPLDLAHCLARVAEWNLGSSGLPAPAMAERNGTALVRRVQRLTMDGVHPDAGTGMAGRSLRVAGAAAVLALVLLAPRAAIGGTRVLPGAQRGVFMFRLDSATTGRVNGVTMEQDVRIIRFDARP